jgi:dihydroorotate dehydrogenase (fumarate)
MGKGLLEMNMQTEYMGMKLRNPVVASAGPLAGEIDGIRRLEDAGVAAVVLPSLFEEQVEQEEQELDYFLHYGTERFAESLSYYPEPEEFHFAGDQYLEHIAKARASVDIPVIASLNGVSAAGWTSYARKMQDAGASALELNVYFLPTNPQVTSEQVQEVYLAALKAVKSATSIPVAMKLSPFLSAPAWMASQLDAAGADALVLFNRFYQPDIDLDALEVSPKLVLSEPHEARLPMRWIAILYGEVSASLAATSGVHSGRDVAKMVLAGADVAMMTSALLKHGPEHVQSVLRELQDFMEDKGYDSLESMRGVLSHKSCPEPAAFERANYMKTLHSYRASGTRE